MSWQHFWRRKRRDEDLANEIESYLAHETDRQQSAQGSSTEEARFAAQRKLGNPTALRESIWEMNSLTFVESIWQDLRFATRTLRLSPGFFLVAALSLALGIGANTAIFQFLDAVRLRSLPVQNPEQLVNLRIADTPNCCNGNFRGRWANFTYAQWQQIKANQTVFSGIFAWSDTRFNLSPNGEVHSINGVWVSGDYFKTLGVQPLLGHLIEAKDDTAACPSPAAVISYGFWQTYFGGDTAVLGKSLLLDGHPIPVAGVTPASFFGVEVGHNFDVMLPLCTEASFGGEQANMLHRHHWWLGAFGRLKPGVSLAQANAQLKTISRTVFENTVPENYLPDLAQYYRAYQLTALPAAGGLSNLRKSFETPLYLLLSISGLVLLIAYANLANLMLAKAETRSREMAIRQAIGAGRSRLIRQLLSESLLLSACGAVLGVLLALFLSRYMLTLLTTTQNQVSLSLTPDWHILCFTGALAILTCLIFGLMPALRSAEVQPATAMKASGRGLTATRESFSLRRILVVAQVALSLLLLASALLFVRSLHNLTTLDAGLRQDGALVMTADISRLNYAPARRAHLFQQLVENVSNTPGVESAAATSVIPLAGDYWNEVIEIPGAPAKTPLIAWFSSVSSNYFHTAQIPLIAGRDFGPHDQLNTLPVALVNQEFARRFLAGANPINRDFRLVVGPNETPRHYQIVGLVKDSKYSDLREEYKPLVYLADAQNPEPRTYAQILIRSDLPFASLHPALKSAVNKTDPEVSIEFSSLKILAGNSLVRDRLMATLSSFFGLLAAVLSTLGLYGVMSYIVSRRRSEIGIRIALGASRANVLHLILTEAAILLCAGLVVGTVATLATGKFATSLLFGLTPGDPFTIALAIALLGAVALLASFIPALRAARTEPVSALRED